MASPIKNTIAPNLPVATREHEEVYFNQFNNILRLYFNTIDAFTSGINNDNGGINLSFPYISASDTTDQYAAGDDTPTVITWNTLESGSGFVLESPGSASNGAGVYKITYSLQFANTDNAPHDAVVWLRVNGEDAANSSTKFTIPARKSAGVPSYICGYSEVVFELNTGDEVELYWATDKAYSTTGPVDGVYIEYIPAQTSPYAHPAAPSAIGSITFLSRL